MKGKIVSGMEYKRWLILLLLAIGFLCWGEAVQAQEYPAKPITFIIANAPVGGLDICARILGQEAVERPHQLPCVALHSGDLLGQEPAVDRDFHGPAGAGSTSARAAAPRIRPKKAQRNITL